MLSKPMRVTYMPGGVGAVAYNAVVAQRPADAGTLVAWSSGSLLNLAQGKFGRFDETRCAGWRPSAPATAPSR
jgi:putative tricarboxylic transport membrane protein